MFKTWGELCIPRNGMTWQHRSRIISIVLLSIPLSASVLSRISSSFRRILFLLLIDFPSCSATIYPSPRFDSPRKARIASCLTLSSALRRGPVISMKPMIPVCVKDERKRFIFSASVLQVLIAITTFSEVSWIELVYCCVVGKVNMRRMREKKATSSIMIN